MLPIDLKNAPFLFLMMGLLASCVGTTLAEPVPAADHVIWQTGESLPASDHGITTLLQGKAKAEIVQGRMRLSCENRDARAEAAHTFRTEPFPTRVDWKFRTLTPDINGKMILKVEDSITGASIQVGCLPGNSYAIYHGESSQWTDWKKYVTVPLGENAERTVSIAQIAPDQFQVMVNGKIVAAAIPLNNLRLIDNISLRSQSQGEVEIIAIAASREPGAAQTADHARKVEVNLMGRGTPLAATNPRANGYQIAYFERGFSDGMTDPSRRAELIAALRELHAGSLRFPGGTWAYWYNSASPRSIPALARLETDRFAVPYFVRNFSEYRWANDDYFFGICKELGVPAIYQINIGTWYDPKTDRAVKLAAFDRKLRTGQLAERVALGKDAAAVSTENAEGGAAADPDVDTSFMKDATRNAAELARKVKDLGVDVTWEFGNEDYGKFSPRTYVRQCKAFVDAIRKVDPQARFIFCGDSTSWSDFAWQDGVLAELNKNGLANLDEASVHLYLTGGGGGPRDTGAKAYEASLYAWSQLRSMYGSTRKRLDEAGLKNTVISLTEFNVVHLLKHYTGLPLEHSMGRALGEAAIWPDFITRFHRVVYHDLVRNGYGHGTWFARLYYLPGNPSGSRYVLPLDAKVMSVMHRHADNQILLGETGLVVSQGNDGVLISIGNPKPFNVSYTLSLKGDRGFGPIPASWQCWTVPDLNCPDYTACELPLQLNNGVLNVTVPGFSFSHVTLPFQGNKTSGNKRVNSND